MSIEKNAEYSGLGRAGNGSVALDARERELSRTHFQTIKKSKMDPGVRQDDGSGMPPRRYDANLLRRGVSLRERAVGGEPPDVPRHRDLLGPNVSFVVGLDFVEPIEVVHHHSSGLLKPAR